MGRSPADPLAPRSRQEQMEFVMALAAGEKAAKYFIHRWPKLFEGHKPEPVCLYSSPKFEVGVWLCLVNVMLI